jgi:hypothetical protein
VPRWLARSRGGNTCKLVIFYHLRVVCQVWKRSKRGGLFPAETIYQEAKTQRDRTEDAESYDIDDSDHGTNDGHGGAGGAGKSGYLIKEVQHDTYRTE